MSFSKPNPTVPISPRFKVPPEKDIAKRENGIIFTKPPDSGAYFEDGEPALYNIKTKEYERIEALHPENLAYWDSEKKIWVYPKSSIDREGNFYGYDTIQSASNLEKSSTESYAASSAAQKTTTAQSEAVSIRGMVNVPVASNFQESKQSINELAAQKGDFSKINDIDICAWMGDIPKIDLDITNFKLGDLPSINDILAGINGITLPALQLASDAITGVIGKISDTVSQIASDIQSQIPTISCGKPKPAELPEPDSTLGDTISSNQEEFRIDPFTDDITSRQPPPYGVDPNIVIESPDVTVQSLNDTIDAGEFG